MSNLPRSLDFAASGISTAQHTAVAENSHVTPPLSPAVMRAAASSRKRFSTGTTPRAGDAPSASAGGASVAMGVGFSGKPHPISPHLGRPISPRVLEAAAQSSQRRLTYKASKDDLKIPPALEEGPDDSSTTSDEGQQVYSLQEMQAIRAAMGSRSGRMRHTYTTHAVPVSPPQGLRGAPDSGGKGGAWRGSAGLGGRGAGGAFGGDNGGGGGRWGHARGGAAGGGGGGQQQSSASVEREVADSDIDQSVPRQQGVIVFMPNAKYGFIRPDRRGGGGDGAVAAGQGKQGDYFFHATEIRDPTAVPRIGDVVTFQIARPSWSNRILAVRVTITASAGGAGGAGAGEREFGSHFNNSRGGFGNGHGWRGGGGGGGGGGSGGDGGGRWGGPSRGGWRSGGSRDSTPSKPSGDARVYRSGASNSGGRGRGEPRSGDFQQHHGSGDRGGRHRRTHSGSSSDRGRGGHHYEGRVAVGPSPGTKSFAQRRRWGGASSDVGGPDDRSTGSSGSAGFEARRKAAAAAKAAALVVATNGGGGGGGGERRVSPNRRSLNTRAAARAVK